MRLADVDASNDLRVLRNFIVHRSRQSAQTYEELLLRREVTSAPLVGEYLCDGNPRRLHQHVEQLRLTAGRLMP
jgi:hypothetical protein